MMDSPFWKIKVEPNHNSQENIQKIFKYHGLVIIIQCNIFNSNEENYKPYTKPNNEIKYVHKNSNDSPNVIRKIPLSIESRLSTLSFNEKIFQEAVPPSQKVLQNSGYRRTLTYKRPKNYINKNKINRNRKQQIMYSTYHLN